jgi:hypothetical protein
MGWEPAGVLEISSYGVDFELTANRAALLETALRYLPLEYRKSASGAACARFSLFDSGDAAKVLARRYRLDRDGVPVFKCSDRAEFFERFRSEVTLHVAEASAERTFIHAGVVGWGNRAILIPGRSFSGKTTLVAALVRVGATYYSDEFAVVDKNGLIHPYAQPLQIRENGSHRQTQHRVEALGGVAGHKPLVAGLVIVSRHKPGAQWRPRTLTPGLGLLQLLDNTVSARRAPAVALSTLKQVVSNATIVRGMRGEASQVVRWIAANLGSAQSLAEQTR